MDALPTTLPSVSVVIPVRDDAAALHVCLTRLAAQTRAPLEVIVVDSGSSDDSAAVAAAAGARVLAEARAGVGAAAACGYDAALGDVIARCDADSVVPDDWVERIELAFAADPGLDAMTGPGRFADVPRPWGATASTAYAIGIFIIAGAAIGRMPLWGSNMAMRSELWASVAHCVARDDAELHDDLDLSMQLAPDARVRFDRHLRVHAEGRIFRSREDMRRRFASAMRTFRRSWTDGRSPGRRWLGRLVRPRGVRA